MTDDFVYVQIMGVCALVVLLWGSTSKDRGQSTRSISIADKTKGVKVSNYFIEKIMVRLSKDARFASNTMILIMRLY